MAKKPAQKTEKSAAAQTSMLHAEGRAIRPVPLAEIQPDPRQPRTDDEKKAANVANICETLNVDEDGVAHPQHPIQIRKTPPWAPEQNRPWMLFDGECRYLAAVVKGAAAIDTDTVDIPEAEVHERQVLTAMARQGLGPSALLEALRRFDIDHKDVNAKNAAVRLGIPEATIRSLRKVNVLPAEVRLRFMGGEHTLEVCDSLSRIEGATAEDRAERQCLASKAVAGMAPKKAREYVASQFLLRLATAPFDREDPTLNPDAGVCSACPHRTGAQAALFGETDEAEDCCTKVACWSAKIAASAPKDMPPEKEKQKAKAATNKPTKDDVVVAALLAAGADAEELDAKLDGKTRDEINASLERLHGAGNPRAMPALHDRRAKGMNIGGYSRGSAFIMAGEALDKIRDAMAKLSPPDTALFLRGVLEVTGGFLTFIDPGAPTSDVACEPGGEPPPPPPAAPTEEDPWLDAPLTADEQQTFTDAEKQNGVPWDDDIDDAALLEDS